MFKKKKLNKITLSTALHLQEICSIFKLVSDLGLDVISPRHVIIRIPETDSRIGGTAQQNVLDIKRLREYTEPHQYLERADQPHTL